MRSTNFIWHDINYYVISYSKVYMFLSYQSARSRVPKSLENFTGNLYGNRIVTCGANKSPNSFEKV